VTSLSLTKKRQHQQNGTALINMLNMNPELELVGFKLEKQNYEKEKWIKSFRVNGSDFYCNLECTGSGN